MTWINYLLCGRQKHFGVVGAFWDGIEIKSATRDDDDDDDDVVGSHTHWLLLVAHRRKKGLSAHRQADSTYIISLGCKKREKEREKGRGRIYMWVWEPSN